MSEMVERVARLFNTPPYEGSHEHALVMARRMIEAMREPTTAMVNGGIRTGVDIGFGCGYPEYVDIYKAMIDKALK